MSTKRSSKSDVRLTESQIKGAKKGRDQLEMFVQRGFRLIEVTVKRESTVNVFKVFTNRSRVIF